MTQNELKIIFFFFKHILTLYWDHFRLILKLKTVLFFLKAFNITAAHSATLTPLSTLVAAHFLTLSPHPHPLYRQGRGSSAANDQVCQRATLPSSPSHPHPHPLYRQGRGSSAINDQLCQRANDRFHPYSLMVSPPPPLPIQNADVAVAPLTISYARE